MVFLYFGPYNDIIRRLAVPGQVYLPGSTWISFKKNQLKKIRIYYILVDKTAILNSELLSKRYNSLSLMRFLEKEKVHNSLSLN